MRLKPKKAYRNYPRKIPVFECYAKTLALMMWTKTVAEFNKLIQNITFKKYFGFTSNRVTSYRICVLVVSCPLTAKQY